MKPWIHFSLASPSFFFSPNFLFYLFLIIKNSTTPAVQTWENDESVSCNLWDLLKLPETRDPSWQCWRTVPKLYFCVLKDSLNPTSGHFSFILYFRCLRFNFTVTVTGFNCSLCNDPMVWVGFFFPFFLSLSTSGALQPGRCSNIQHTAHIVCLQVCGCGGKSCEWNDDLVGRLVCAHWMDETLFLNSVHSDVVFVCLCGSVLGLS